MRDREGLTEAEAEAVWGILVEEAGARDTDDNRYCFVRYVTTTEQAEWRFMGKLGFGGKLYTNRFDPPRVGCYPEHMNPERAAIIERTNARLSELSAALAKEEGSASQERGNG
jgi:hypothetical protein